MKDEKMLERIRRLLAMAGDTSSPHEAAIAAGRARKLMDAHQVTELDLKQARPEDFGTARYPLKRDTWTGVLAVAMAWLNDVNVREEFGKRGFINVVFEGYLVDTVTAKELYLYLLAQADVQAKANGGRRVDFKRGFACGVQQQVLGILKEREQITTSDGKGLVVSKRAAVTNQFGAMATTSARSGKQNANYSAGFAAGQKTGLNRQVSGEGQRRIR